MVIMAPMTNPIKAQRLQWFVYIMRKSENNIVELVMERKTLGKILRERPRKKWIDATESHLKNSGIDRRRKLFQDRNR